MLSDYIERSLHKIAIAEGMCEYKIESSTMPNACVGLIGIVKAVTITNTVNTSDQCKSHHQLHLVYKTSPASEARRKHLKVPMLFKREIDMYTKVLPTFMRFQREKGLNVEDSFASYPKFFASEFDTKNDIYFLIMEDLHSRNFAMWPKNKTMPLDNVECVLRELGKFHAISFAMQDQRPQQFDQFRKYNDLLSEAMFRGKLNVYMTETIERVISRLENQKHKGIMQHFQRSFIERIDELLNGESSMEFAVIGHGDCWNNNMLFRMDENENSPKSVCFVDWQIGRFGPPVLDLLYFIFTVSDKQLRQENYHGLLKTYYRSLSGTIEKLGSDPQKLYTFDDLNAQLKKFGDIAVLFASMGIQVSVANAEHFSDFDDFFDRIDRNQKAQFVNEYDDKTLAEYTIRINDLFTDLDSYGYLESLESRLNSMQRNE